MDALPDEVVLNILSYLHHPSLVTLQSVSRRFLILARDTELWKTLCFEHSRSEALRRRQHLLGLQETRIAELRNAVSALPGSDLTAWEAAQLQGSSQGRVASDPEAEARLQRLRALANWEPGYAAEGLDYYEEYVQRHAAVQVGWLELPKATEGAVREATGVGTIVDKDGRARAVVAPLDDGSIGIWDVRGRSTSSPTGRGGKMLGRSAPGLLTSKAPDATAQNRTIMTETGAIECVSIDNDTQKGYFAVQDMLHVVDLNTLQLSSTKQYPFPVTTLSSSRAPTKPLVVGTNWTIHLHDPRDSAFSSSAFVAGGELIGGSVYSHATLTQPGPLSILSTEGDDSIWVAGRFTSMLSYSSRYFPRLLGTMHSGARIASLSHLPYPLVPRSLDLLRNPSAGIHQLAEAKRAPGTTLLAAAEYKGKGSLELYGLPGGHMYQNRQTASASKLLSIAPHGGKIVFSDGDGNLKWVERDGFSHVRTFNINDSIAANTPGQTDASAYGIWSSTASEMPGQGDIVQKILPTHPVTSATTSSRSSDRSDVNQNNLLLWTGDGRLGMLGFGHGNPLGEMADTPDTGSVEERAREDAERQYGMAMRRALERNADEVRFVRGLGMGYMP